MGAKEKISRYNLVTSEDTYASQTAQNPATARKLQSWIPADDGQLTRELADVKFDTTQLSGPVVGLYEYDYNDLNGNVNRIYFAAARTNFTPSTLTCNLYSLSGAGHWTIVNTLNPFGPGFVFADAPALATINNLLHVSDGVVAFIYDGVNNVWFNEGFATQTESPSLNVVGGGQITFLVGRYYWIGYADHTHQHESDASPAFSLGSNPSVVFTHALTNQNVQVYPSSGLASCAAGSSTITRSNSTDVPGSSGGSVTVDTPFFIPQQAAQVSGGAIAYSYSPGSVKLGVWINGTQLVDSGGNPLYVITGGVSTLTLNANVFGTTINNGRMLVAPLRTTHWHIYASEVDGSQVGQFLAAVPVTQNLSTTPYVDSDPGITVATSAFLPIFRPVRNDPPPPSKILAVHKYREWRVRANKPTFFSFSANEEVTSGANGSPQESWPGTSVGTTIPTSFMQIFDSTYSDIVNEYPYPDQSNRIRALISHADALYMFSERQGLPLYGESLDDFALSQITAFAVGIAGRFAGESTPSGLAFMSYDRMLYLYPTSNYPWAYVPKDVNVTDSLIDIGKPQRVGFETIQAVDLDKTWVRSYRYGRRNWLVVSYLSASTTWITIVYDFNTKGWFHLQQGFSSLATFEVSSGAKVLIGGGTDGFVYVADDITGTYVSAGPHPNAIWRPALIDFGDPDSKHVFQYVELEFSSAALEGDTKINYYLDPVNVDSPGTPRSLTLQKVANVGANLYRGWPRGGNACHRLLLEINTAASNNIGSIRSAKLVATKITGLVS